MEIIKRIIVGIFGGTLFVFLLYFSRQTYYFLFLSINILSLHEFYRITSIWNRRILYIYSIIASTIIYTIFFILCYNSIDNIKLFLLALTLLPSLFFIEFFSTNSKRIMNTAFSMLGIVYITLPLSLLHYLSLGNTGYDYSKILILFILIWANDSGAYFIGKFFGKRKLFERISPKKTWEGFFGGLFFSLFISYLITFKISIPFWYIYAICVSIGSTIGDLYASSIKRNFNIKDSSSLLPGHGGFLDRFDSAFIVIPFYTFLQYLLMLNKFY